MAEIIVKLRSSDGYTKSRRFRTLEGAQKFAHDYVGACPEIGAGYAVSDDGVATIRVSGASLRQLFPRAAALEDQLREEGFY